MTSKISRSILLVSLLVFLATLSIIMLALYSYFTGVQKEQLAIESELAAQGVALSGDDYLQAFDDEEYRITWIAQDGAVLFDNKASSGGMENHLEREEIKDAFATGYGESQRYSSTLSERFLYSARLLPDGTVIRVSHAQITSWSLLLGFAQPICFLILLALILSYWLASRLSKKITAPINRIDPDRPETYIHNDEYQEIAPLLIKMTQQQSQIQKDQAELEKTSRIRQEFTANVSHELKTPLQVISGYAELMEQGLAKEEDIVPFSRKIHNESQRMTKLVEDIIDLTKLDSGGQDQQKEPVDLFRIAGNAVDSLRPVADSKTIELTLDGEAAPMTGIPQILYGILYNLCDNAIKYSPEGSHVEVAVQNQASHVLLTVKDNGIGIPEEHQARIFERFYRVDKSRSKEAGGTGLGLSIVKHGALIHNASIDLKSAPGQGTEISVHFPKSAS